MVRHIVISSPNQLVELVRILMLKRKIADKHSVEYDPTTPKVHFQRVI
jgi:hypothetical protein